MVCAANWVMQSQLSEIYPQEGRFRSCQWLLVGLCVGLSFPFICVHLPPSLLLPLLSAPFPSKQQAATPSLPLWNPFTAPPSTWMGSRGDKNRFWPLEPWLFRSITTSMIPRPFFFSLLYAAFGTSQGVDYGSHVVFKDVDRTNRFWPMNEINIQELI